VNDLPISRHRRHGRGARRSAGESVTSMSRHLPDGTVCNLPRRETERPFNTGKLAKGGRLGVKPERLTASVSRPQYPIAGRNIATQGFFSLGHEPTPHPVESTLHAPAIRTGAAGP
jgi:hypothetical protein